MTDTILMPSREHWDKVWKISTTSRPIHTYILAALKQAINLNGARTLEVGCGSAVDSAELAMLGAHTFAADYSRTALMHARAHTERMDASTILLGGDTFHLPYQSNTFDLVFSQGLLEHFTDPTAAIREQIRVLNSGGILCVDVPQTFSLLTLYKRWHIRRGTWFAGWETDYTLGRLEEILRAQDLEVVSSYGWLYFPSVVYGFRNLHTLDERHSMPIWLSSELKEKIEAAWRAIEKQRWFYRWLGCIGVIARKKATREGV